MSKLLEIAGVRAGYDTGDVLHGVDLDLDEGEVVALLGRNGVGKTTLINTVVGFLRPHAGSVRLAGRDLTGASAHEIARAGVAIVPQGRRIFARLTVEENLRLARPAQGERGADWTHESGYDQQPPPRERRRPPGDEL
jgi:branched-chain amino acid transport system ATP-binding protein